MSGVNANRLRALSLYRKILRLHQQKLPDLFRSVGDQYVRQEFRAHRDVTKEQETKFMMQWEDYASHLLLESDLLGVGRELPDSDIESLSDDQKAQLQRLQESAASIGIQAKTDAGENPYEDVKPR